MAIDINLPRVFSENVEVMETSYQIILRSGQGLTSSNKENSANFSGEKSTMKLSGVCIFGQYAKKLKLNLVLVVAFVLESKGLY